MTDRRDATPAAATDATLPADTASAGASGAKPALTGMLGRYRLERELGAGGMGVVHAAFDPDLERRVALKVLLGAGNSDAQQRLLREARAMARLSHANVVVVHEVGTAGGRDYVAMELIDGGTLAEWLRAERRRSSEILDAFIAAGRGLAAAHAAELVHRDFKPHNVLRSRDGRILVTDFGLARSTDAPIVAAATAGASLSENTPSALSGLTATGSVLGTPAYMAPEQWAGGVVGPASDQFAFCVALWEALAGARPYTGTTLDALREQIAAGPARLDASRLPRRVRAILRRGLDPIAAKRWPSMDALLVALIRARSRTALYAGATVVALGAAIAAFAMVGGHHDDTGCEPAHPPPAAWADALGSAGWTELAAIAHRDIARWPDTRAHVCSEPPEHRAQKLACLDAATARLDAVRQAAATLPPAASADFFVAQLVDPATCTLADPPRLALTAGNDAALALALDARIHDIGARPTAAEADALAARPHLDACGHALVQGVQEELAPSPAASRALAEQATVSADACKDDWLIADTVNELAQYDLATQMLDDKGRAVAQRVELAYSRVGQPDIAAPAELVRSRVAREAGHWDEAFAALQRAMDAYGARGRTLRQIETAYELGSAYRARGETADLVTVRAFAAKWRPIAATLHDPELPAGFDRLEGLSAFFLGDVEAGHRALVASLVTPPTPPVHPIEGHVVDERGQPVAGAVVVSGRLVLSDAISVLFPLDPRGLHSATTDGGGHFVIEGDGCLAIVAQLGDHRSIAVPPSDHMTLKLAPTRRITGTVQLGTTAHTKVLVSALSAEHGMESFVDLAPVQADGTFVVDGAPIERIKVGIGQFDAHQTGSLHFQELPASPAPVSGVVLALPSSARVLEVVVRSTLATPLELARVFVVPQHMRPKTIADLMSQIKPAGILSGFAQPATGGDVAIQFTNVPPGELTACVTALSGTTEQVTLNPKQMARMDALELRCAPVAADASRIVVETPPPKRLE